MQKYLFFVSALIYSFLIIGKAAAQQQQPDWYIFYDHKTELSGYKDRSGAVKITPRFGGLSRAAVFRNIIAVTQQRNTHYESYYLLKNGRTTGRDSLYVEDMSFDCEQEGKIRFRDPKTDLAGYLGKDGKVLIPALYNDVRPFHNGYALVLHGGKRLCFDGSPFDPRHPCEHWSWTGTAALIDQSGKVVADSVDETLMQNINWHSLRISDHPAGTALRVSIKAADGRYLTFVDYEKEFRRWFYQIFVAHIDRPSGRHFSETVCVEGIYSRALRRFYSKKKFDAAYGRILQLKIGRIRSRQVKVTIMPETLNPLIFTQKSFAKYYTDCGDANAEDYPQFDMVVDYASHKQQFSGQESFSFLRTAAGYQLIGVSWKDKH